MAPNFMTELATESRLVRDTSVTSDRELGTSLQLRDAYTRIIEDKFIEWGRNPASISEYDLIPPTRIALHVATTIAPIFRDNLKSAPLRTVPDGDGGIVFEFLIAGKRQIFTILKDGELEHALL